MKKTKIAKLNKNGWQIGSATDFLNLSREEAAYVEMKLSLAEKLQQQRKHKHLTQHQLACLIHSSQSRVAKMEKNDPTVSIDLLVKSLLALGSSPNELAQAISFKVAGQGFCTRRPAAEKCRRRHLLQGTACSHTGQWNLRPVGPVCL